MRIKWTQLRTHILHNFFDADRTTYILYKKITGPTYLIGYLQSLLSS